MKTPLFFYSSSLFKSLERERDELFVGLLLRMNRDFHSLARDGGFLSFAREKWISNSFSFNNSESSLSLNALFSSVRYLSLSLSFNNTTRALSVSSSSSREESSRLYTQAHETVTPREKEREKF